MFVQEYGSACCEPNSRCIYISYVDSTNHFTPDIKTASGERLRTFVYQQILVGYLEFCKKRGFSTCYIWAWPPPKHEECIFFCHPKKQKIPTPTKLRKWFKAMLKKASRESIVVSVSNFYDTFFTPHEGYVVTGARFPYLHGDYWPSEAEYILESLRDHELHNQQIVVTERFGKTLHKMKKHFIVVQLHLSCTCCCRAIVSGDRWVCNQCTNFQLCNKCHNEHEKLDERSRHPENKMDKHAFSKLITVRTPQVVVGYASQHTVDNDIVVVTEIFNSPQVFVNFCKHYNFRFDTLGRAKLSTRMILYTLLNPVAPSIIECVKCLKKLEGQEFWKCEICPETHVCKSCYDSGFHDHPLASHSLIDWKQELKDVLCHSSKCSDVYCTVPYCLKITAAFRHKQYCQTPVSDNCSSCRKSWELSKLHSLDCTDKHCTVLYCSDFKEFEEKNQFRFDDNRRKCMSKLKSLSQGQAAKGEHDHLDPVSIESFLDSLNLGNYATKFQEEEVDIAALKLMRQADLKDLGIPMGPTKKILAAIQKYL